MWVEGESRVPVDNGGGRKERKERRRRKRREKGKGWWAGQRKSAGVRV